MAAQVLPLTQYHFGSIPSSYSTSIFAEYQEYQGLQDDRYANYLTDPQVQSFLVSPMAVSSATMQRRSSQSPHAVMRHPPGRNGTPIQLARTTDSRARSQSRSEMLLAYATEPNQVSQAPSQPSVAVISSQSAPTTPQIFPMASYVIQEGTSESYAGTNSYVPAYIPPITSPSAPEFTYAQAGPQFQSYYPLGRSASHPTVSGILNPQETMYMPTQEQGPSQSFPPAETSFPPIPNPLESTTGDLEIMSSRPKPQCWDHGCNGRQFSTFSNLLRHQREKSGIAMKAMCPYCGTEFTRTTARNGHMYGGKCKGVLERDPSETSSTSGKERK